MDKSGNERSHFHVKVQVDLQTGGLNQEHGNDLVTKQKCDCLIDLAAQITDNKRSGYPQANSPRTSQRLKYICDERVC